MKHGFKSQLPFFLMLLPGVFVLAVNNYIPMFGVIMAFQKYRFNENFFKSLFTSEFVGLTNFGFFFKSPNAYIVTRNTILYNLVFIALDIIIPVMLAIGLNELRGKVMKKFYQSTLFLPYFLSWIVVSYLAYSFFSFESGFINRGLLRPLGLESINWYFEPKYWPAILIITLEYECFGWGDTYTPKINPMLAAGEPIDIVFTSNWAANYRVNAVNGYFRELNDFLAKYPAIESVTGKDFLNATQINGKNYALPCNKEQAHNWGFLLKKDLVQEFGIDLKSIKSLEDLEPYFDKVLAEKPGITPLLAVQMDSPWHLLDWNTFSDDDVPGALYNDNRDTKVINQFLAPESIAQYKQMRDYFKKKYIHPDAATQDNFSAEMSTGKYFAFVAPMKPGKAVEMSAQTGIEWEEVFITPIVMSNREADGAMLAIPIGSKNPERAFQFIELLYTDAKLKNLMNYGVENRDYKFIGENRIEIIPNSGYASSGGWRFGDNLKDYLMAGEAENKAELWREYNKAGLPLINLGFVFDATNVANEVAACKDVVQTYYKQLFTGSVDPDPVVKEMEAAFKTAGADLVIAEMQKQFDEWLITNKK